jgi:hypothetical protein
MSFILFDKCKQTFASKKKASRLSYVSLQKICEERRNTGVSDPDANSPTTRMLDDSNSEEFGMRELLYAIAAAYDKINVVHGKFCLWSFALCHH